MANSIKFACDVCARGKEIFALASWRPGFLPHANTAPRSSACAYFRGCGNAAFKSPRRIAGYRLGRVARRGDDSLRFAVRPGTEAGRWLTKAPSEGCAEVVDEGVTGLGRNLLYRLGCKF